MLNRRPVQVPHRGLSNQQLPVKQQGVVLVIALIVLVAMTLAGIALVRSVDTTNIIAGNLAFQQAATQQGDRGVETAIAWLQANNTPTMLNSNSPSNGYIANGAAANQSPAANVSWDSFWNSTLGANPVTLQLGTSTAEDPNTGNTIRYVIQRMCSSTGAAFTATSCSSSSQLTAGSSGQGEEGGEVQLNALSMVFYRITTRIDGPRNTVSYVQAMVAL